MGNQVPTSIKHSTNLNSDPGHVSSVLKACPFHHSHSLAYLNDEVQSIWKEPEL